MTYTVGSGGTIDNYTDLQAAIKDLLNRPDLTSQPATWIQLAEAQMNRSIRSRWMLSRSQTFTISAEYVSLPADFVGVKSFQIVSTTPCVKLTYQTPEVMDELAAQRWNGSDTPCDYTILGSEFRFSPVPGGSYTAQLTYYQRIPALAANPTNWLLTNHPDAYLYGAALQSVPYLSDDERTEEWAAAFAQIIADINSNDAKESQGQSLRSRPAFAP